MNKLEILVSIMVILISTARRLNPVWAVEVSIIVPPDYDPDKEYTYD